MEGKRNREGEGNGDGEGERGGEGLLLREGRERSGEEGGKMSVPVVTNLSLHHCLPKWL